MKYINLKSKEGIVRRIETDLAKMSVTLKDMIEVSEVANDEESDGEVVPLTTIAIRVLDKIIEYMKYHLNDPKEDSDSDEDQSQTKSSDDLCEWDQSFIDVDRELLFELIVAANFLDIKGLLDIGCKTAANQIKDKSAEEVRKIWQIENDLSPEEDERLKRENEWADN